MPAQYRTLHFKNFLAGVTNVLVCTDLASRGLDTTFVQHVIHFDFPFSVLDFIHRVGRTARNGAKGKSTGLLEKKDRVLASAIERLSARGLSIEQLSADRSRYGPDGLPLSSSTDPARYHASYQAPARLQPSTYTSDGKKVLAPTRRPAANNGLKPGEEPRRRWMRYMAPKDRNQHKLLYSKFAHRDAQGERQAEGDRSEAAHSSSSRKQGGLHPSKPGTIKKKHASSSSSSSDPDHDPFAFSSPYGRNRNATHVQPKGTVPDTRFPQAPGTLKRTQAARPVGPLAHKQRVGAIFASGNSQTQAATHKKKK
jgi:superfamily II DNA/RNA helicase